MDSPLRVEIKKAGAIVLFWTKKLYYWLINVGFN